jgi:tetratricopeptide (TPR) repeat protein
MPGIADRQIPPPSNWQDFESLCADLWTRIWGDPATQRNGRQGQRQQGVDIYGRPGQGDSWAGVQCKLKGLGTALTQDELLQEAEKVRGFRPPLAALIVATTARRDARLQEVARLLTQDHLSRGSFTVQVVFWEDILSLLTGYPELFPVHLGSMAPPALPAQAPALPSHYVPRPVETEHLLRRLCADAGGQVLAIGALHGLGGIGKSTLAAAVARSPLAREHFRDGVLWATLGQQPDLLSLISQWIHALGDHDFRPTSVTAASGHLRSMLHRKAALLVIDDAWSSEHVLPFLAGGELARVLVTTRRADVADEVGAELFHLDVMDPDQALAILASFLGRDLEGQEKGEARAVAAAVGYSPLALELAAARVRRGVSWERLRAALEQEVARLEELESVRRRRGAPARLEASLNLSLEALRAEDETAWRSFVALGVLPEDAVLASPLAATIWGLSEEAAEELLELLWSDALLLAAPPISSGSRSRRGYRLHDLLHDVARRRLTDKAPRGLGSTLPAAHAALLGAYHAACREGLWQSLPDDGYIHARLAWHLEKAGQFDGLHLLLREETAAGGNAWFEVRQAMGQIAGYLADVARAWRLCESEPGPDAAVAIGRQCFYAGVTATFVSLAANVPPALISALLRHGVWAAPQALAYARQAPTGQCAASLLRIIPLLQEPMLMEIPLAARDLDDGPRAEVLAALAKRANGGFLAKILAEARTLGNEAERSKVLLPVLARLPDPLLADGLAAVAELQETGARLFGLLLLVARLPGDLLGAVLELLAREEDGEFRALMLREIAPQLPAEFRNAAAELVVAIEEKPWRAIAIFSLAVGSLGSEYLRETAGDQPWGTLVAQSGLPALVAGSTGLDDSHWAAGVLALPLRRWLERLAATKMGKAFQRQIGLEPPPVTLEAILDPGLAGAVLPWLPAQHLRSALHAVCDREEALFADVLPALFPYLSTAGRKAAVLVALELSDASLRSRLLLALRERADGQLADLILSALLSAAPPPELLVELVPGLSGRFLETAWEEGSGRRPARDRRSAAGRAPRINLLADRKTSPLTLAALEDEEKEGKGDSVPLPFEGAMGVVSSELLCVLRTTWEEGERMEILDLLSARVQAELTARSRRLTADRAQAERAKALAHLKGHWDDALAEIRSLEPAPLRALALRSIVRFLPEERLEDAVTIVGGAEDRSLRAEVLSGLVARLPAVRLSEIPDLARRLGPSGRWLLHHALPHLPQTEQTAVLTQALDGLRDLPRGAERGQAFQDLLASTPAPLMRTALVWASEERQDGVAEALGSLAPRLPQSALPMALNLALREGDGRKRAWALLALIPRLAAEDETVALTEVVRIASKLEAESQAGLLVALASKLRGAAFASVLHQALAAIRECRQEEDRNALLLIVVARLGRGIPLQAASPAVTGLAPHAVTLWSAILEGLATVQGSARAEILSRMAACLPGELLAQAWELALEGRSDTRLPALTALARRLGELPMERMLEAVWFQGSKRERSAVLRAVVAALPAERRESLTRSLRDRPSARSQLLSLIEATASLTASVSRDQLRELLALSATIDDVPVVATALWSLGLHAPPGRRRDVIVQSLETLSLVRDEGQQAEMLLRMGLQTPDDLQSEVLGRALGLSSKQSRAAVLAGLAPRWPETVLTLIDENAGLDLSSAGRATILGALGSQLSPAGLARALTQVRRLTTEEDRLAALVGLSPLLSGELWGEALEQLRGLTVEALRARGLATLSPGAPPNLLPELLREARSLPGKLRLLVLHSLISRFYVDLPFEELVNEALALGEGGLWVKVLAPAAAEVPKAQRKRAWNALQRLPRGIERRMVIASLAPDRHADSQEWLSWADLQGATDGLDPFPLAAEAHDLLDEPSPPPRTMPARAAELPREDRQQSLLHLANVIGAARSAARLLGDEEGAQRLFEHAAGLALPHFMAGDLAAGVAEVWTPAPETGFPLPPPESSNQPERLAPSPQRSSRGQLLAVGQAAFDREWYQAAINVWSRLFLLDPDDAEAEQRIHWARERLPQGTGPKAVGPRSYLRSLPPAVMTSEIRRQQLLAEGQDAFDHGLFHLAIEAWSRIFFIDIDDVEAAQRIAAARECLVGNRVALLSYFEAALQALDSGEFNKVKTLCELILQNAPSFTAASDLLRHADHSLQIEGQLLVAEGAAQRGWIGAAREAWTRILQLDPSNAEALEGIEHTALMTAEAADRFRALVTRALNLLDGDALDEAVDLWLEALAIDIDARDCSALREAAAQRFDPLCRSRVAEILSRARICLDQGETDDALRLATEILRIEPSRNEAMDVVREARRLRAAEQETKTEEIRDEILRALRQGNVDAALGLLSEIYQLDSRVTNAHLVARELSKLIRTEQSRLSLQRELARFRADCRRGDKNAAREVCARIFATDQNQQLAGWVLQLSRGFPAQPDPALLFWPPVKGPREPQSETLVVLATMSLEDQDPRPLARFIQAQAELDRGELEAAVASWQSAGNAGPSGHLHIAARQLQDTAEPLGPEDIEQVLALLDEPPRAWSEEEGAWARSPEELVMHIARILPWIPDAWVLTLVPPVLSLSSAYLFSEALSRLAPRLATLPPETLRPWWNELLRSLVNLPRPRFLAALSLLAPVLLAMGGEEGSPEVAAAIFSLARGWP